MNFLKKLFGQGFNKNEPSEPIFPGESFNISRLTFPEGWGLATFNKKYDHYPNKTFFPWHVLIELELVSVNENGHPLDIEAETLATLEADIFNFLHQKHTVHFVGRVTRIGFRDLFYYIDMPRFEQTEVDTFCDNIMKERGINFGIEKDPNWTAVSGFVD